MRAFSDRLILAFLGGALDPPLARRLTSELASDPLLAARVQGLRERLGELVEPPHWRLPPPGLPVGLKAILAREAEMGAAPLRAGDLFAARLVLDETEPRLVVVLVREDGLWRVLLPAAVEERLLLTDLDLDDQGARILHLSVAEAPPDQRWAVALPLATLPVDMDAPLDRRWTPLMEALERGDVPVYVFEARLGEPWP